MHRIDKYAQMLRIDVRSNAVPQVEDVPRPFAVAGSAIFAGTIMGHLLI